MEPTSLTNQTIQLLDDFHSRMWMRTWRSICGPAFLRKKYPLGLITDYSELNKNTRVKSIERRPDTWLCFNFNHGGELYLVELPKEGPEALFYFREPFAELNIPATKASLMGAHAGALLGFSAERPLILHPQNDRSEQTPISIRSTVYGSYYVGGAMIVEDKLVAEPYSPKAGVLPGGAYYGTTQTLQSTEQWLRSAARVKEHIAEKNIELSPIKLFEIEMAQIYPDKYLSFLIFEADRRNRTYDTYNTAFNNCLTPLVTALKKSKKKRWDRDYTLLLRSLVGKISPARVRWLLERNHVYAGASFLDDNPYTQLWREL